MATATIFNFFNLPKAATYYTTVDIPTKWIIIWLPNHGYQFPTSKSTWKPNFAQIRGFLYVGSHFGFKMATMANQRFTTSLSTWKPNFAQFGGFLYLAAILYLGYHANSHHFEFFQPQKLPHTTMDIPTHFHEV
jgi:hypothetical protein